MMGYSFRLLEGTISAVLRCGLSPKPYKVRSRLNEDVMHNQAGLEPSMTIHSRGTTEQTPLAEQQNRHPSRYGTC